MGGGEVETPWLHPSSREASQMRDLTSHPHCRAQRGVGVEACLPLCPQQPLRARHCRECRRCVRRYDHHCPWMENCVGERNHPLFVAYLALQLVVLLWGLYLAWWVPPAPWVWGGEGSMHPPGV